jgi:hypothetical protein
MQGHHFRSISAAACLIMVLCQQGCFWIAQDRILPAEIAAGATGEIDGTYASYGQVEGFVAAVVWSDLPAVRCSSGTSRGEAQFVAHHLDTAGREIRWQSRVSSDRTGAITINGKNYDLADGRLLLATINSGKPIVKQLRYDLEQFDDQDLLESLRGWLGTEAEIRGFFSSAAE